MHPRGLVRAHCSAVALSHRVHCISFLPALLAGLKKGDEDIFQIPSLQARRERAAPIRLHDEKVGTRAPGNNSMQAIRILPP